LPSLSTATMKSDLPLIDQCYLSHCMAMHGWCPQTGNKVKATQD